MIDYKTIGENLFQLSKDYSEDGIEIAKGFIWNGISVPWWLRWLIRSTDKTKEAGMVHDMAYGAGNGVARKVADKIFLRKLLEDGVSSVKAKAMYYGVRVFGFLYFKP